MTRRDISELVEAFAGAARRLRDATFDGVEVDASGGFLLAEYLSPKVNRRADEYGGNLENRCRFVVEVLRGVRQAIGGSLALGIRLSPDPIRRARHRCRGPARDRRTPGAIGAPGLRQRAARPAA